MSGFCDRCGHTPYSAMYGRCPSCEAEAARRNKPNKTKEDIERSKKYEEDVKRTQDFLYGRSENNG